jgi:hypothetical protein
MTAESWSSYKLFADGCRASSLVIATCLLHLTSLAPSPGRSAALAGDNLTTWSMFLAVLYRQSGIRALSDGTKDARLIFVLAMPSEPEIETFVVSLINTIVYAELLLDRAPAGRHQPQVWTAICAIFLFNRNQAVHAL